MSNKEKINHPSHYNFGEFEVIDVIEDWMGFDFHKGNIIKYVVRAGKKSDSSALDDLKKARFYLNRIIDCLEKK